MQSLTILFSTFSSVREITNVKGSATHDQTAGWIATLSSLQSYTFFHPIVKKFKPNIKSNLFFCPATLASLQSYTFFHPIVKKFKPNIKSNLFCCPATLSSLQSYTFFHPIVKTFKPNIKPNLFFCDVRDETLLNIRY